jgi:hypothetical protein
VWHAAWCSGKCDCAARQCGDLRRVFLPAWQFRAAPTAAATGRRVCTRDFSGSKTHVPGCGTTLIHTAEMLGLFVVAPTAFVAPSRRSSVVPARAAVRLESERPETEMEYLKRRADEKGENGGGWSIFKAKDEDAKPDPPWLVASKARAKQRAERMESTKDTKRPWWKGAEYSDEDSAGLPAAPSVPWFKRMDDSPAEESLAEESSAPAADADAEK